MQAIQLLVSVGKVKRTHPMNKAKLLRGMFGLIACGLLCRVVFADNSGWEFKKEEKGVKVYTQKVEGSNLKEFRGVASVKASMDQIVTLFEDTPSGCAWIYKCKEFKELKVKSQDEKFFYFRQELSWPVHDRDIVDYRIRKQDPNTKVLTYHISETSENLYPEQKDVVRMPYLRVLWQFTPKENGMVEIDYQIHADPGGRIPKWLVNRLSMDIPVHTLNQFEEALERK